VEKIEEIEGIKCKGRKYRDRKFRYKKHKYKKRRRKKMPTRAISGYKSYVENYTK
jgi:hypothetical protein